MGLIDRQMEIIHVPASYDFYRAQVGFFWIFGMLSIIFGPNFNILHKLAISQGTTFSFFSEISLKNEKMKMFSLVKLPIYGEY